jgi:hypothetical protein
MAFFVPLPPAPDDYPNHLAAPEPERLRLPSARWLLVLLVLLCMLPRAVMALRIPSVCPDGVLYIHLAQALEAGDFRMGSQEMSLNIYPMLLVILHRLGLGWELGAALWGIGIASLVVLPLWGWARRQFDDRVALVACLLYIVNPKMIEWSPEVMRDPTFWFLFMLSIYWLWRAVTEVHRGYFAAAGAAIALASVTRIEGLFLLIPLVLWTFWRWRALRTGHTRLMGAALCVAVVPLLLLLVNMAWLYGRFGATLVRLDPLARVGPWLASMLGHAAAGTGDSLEPPMTVGRMMWVFIPTMTRGLSPVFALLMFGGIYKWRRVWARRDHQPLFYTAVVIMCGIWVQLWYDRQICPRYALPIVLMASVLAALGLLGLIDRWLRIATQRWHWGSRRRLAAVVAVGGIVVAFGLGDAMTSNTTYFETRQMAADLGRWVDREFPSRPMLVGPVGITPIVSYYAENSPYQAFRWEASDASIMAVAERQQACIVVLRPTKQLTSQRCEALVSRLKSAGMEPMDRSALPPSCDDLRVLVRGQRGPRVAGNPAQAY